MFKKIMLVLILSTITSFSQQFQLEWKTPSGARAFYFGDLDGDSVGEFLIADAANNVTVYDGLGHNVKWTFTLPSSDNIRARYGYGEEGMYIPVSPLCDFNRNGIKDLFIRDVTLMLSIVDPSTNTSIHKFTVQNADVIGMDDVDNDNQLELILTDNDSVFYIYSTEMQTTSVKSNATLMENNYKLYQNYPNPFNPSTLIEYEIQTKSRATIRIFNSLGQCIRTLVDEDKAPGTYTAYWDGKDKSGATVATSQYYYQLQVGEFVSSKKMLMIK